MNLFLDENLSSSILVNAPRPSPILEGALGMAKKHITNGLILLSKNANATGLQRAC